MQRKERSSSAERLLFESSGEESGADEVGPSKSSSEELAPPPPPEHQLGDDWVEIKTSTPSKKPGECVLLVQGRQDHKLYSYWCL